VIDAHAHPGTPQERRIRERLGIATLLCGTDPASAADVLACAVGSAVFTPCCALHPWKAADFPPEAMLPFLEMCPVVGETGLDSVWCDTPMTAQTEVFLWHLDYAQRAGKPVVLHTKGREREAAQILRRYSMPKVVHWYSCEEAPGDYLEQGCYFTIGPDAETNPTVRRVAALAPLDRLLTETDGLNAVTWALGRNVEPEELPAVLRSELCVIAGEKKLPVETVARAVERNYHHLLFPAHRQAK